MHGAWSRELGVGFNFMLESMPRAPCPMRFHSCLALFKVSIIDRLLIDFQRLQIPNESPDTVSQEIGFSLLHVRCELIESGH